MGFSYSISTLITQKFTKKAAKACIDGGTFLNLYFLAEWYLQNGKRNKKDGMYQVD